jgi:hypothetical protein
MKDHKDHKDLLVLLVQEPLELDPLDHKDHVDLLVLPDQVLPEPQEQ